MSFSHDKGYRAEHAVEMYLQEKGILCYRPRAGSHSDVGDLGGVCFPISIKDHATLTLAAWIVGLERMALHARADTGAVWHKRKGTSNPGRWYVTTTGDFFVPLYQAYEAVQAGRR